MTSPARIQGYAVCVVAHASKRSLKPEYLSAPKSSAHIRPRRHPHLDRRAANAVAGHEARPDVGTHSNRGHRGSTCCESPHRSRAHSTPFQENIRFFQSQVLTVIRIVRSGGSSNVFAAEVDNGRQTVIVY